MAAADTQFSQAIEYARTKAEEAGVFESITLEGGELVCKALGSAEEAFYRLQLRDEGLFVVLDMKDRWQSESIESDLMHSGDSLEELFDEELAELGYEGDTPTYQHYRDDQMRFVFQSHVPIDGKSSGEAGEIASQYLLGYEACFRQLGDMDEDGGED
ncbi:MAG: hypothetical protein ED559_03215 [Phycisphaera sp.]|nr:MAG: hypothetical protein ED559_03215 [Phycisphaera sp.]